MTAVMTNQAILTKAIQKAIDGGFDLNKAEGRRYPNDGFQKHVDPRFYVKQALDYGADMVYWLIFNHDFAKALWGELELTKWLPHDVPAKRPDFRPWNNGFKDWSDVPEYYWYCANCKMPWRNTFYTKCEKVKHGNPGWQYHLQMMVIADDPIAYLGEHI